MGTKKCRFSKIYILHLAGIFLILLSYSLKLKKIILNVKSKGRYFIEVINSQDLGPFKKKTFRFPYESLISSCPARPKWIHESVSRLIPLVHTNGLHATCKEDLSAWTSIEGNLSDFLNLDISVIQRSTLGPMLFLCYINDFMVMYCYVLRVILFADDTTSLAKGPVLKDLTEFFYSERWEL
jgi:hypothetical protein